MFCSSSGVDWTPVDEAKLLLKKALSAVVSSGARIPVEDGFDRILSSKVDAVRSNPSGSNSAVDGFGGRPIVEGPQVMKLCDGRAAAGVPFPGRVQPGQAVRILTGAILLMEWTLSFLEEDCTIESDRIAFNGPLKQWSNTREAGEDVIVGAQFSSGRRLTSTDLSLLASAGVDQVDVYSRLRVGVLSTGDELRLPGQSAEYWQIYDANRLMLLSMVRDLGFEAVDLGLVEDSRDTVREALN